MSRPFAPQVQKFEGGEACPCRILAFLDVGPLTVEEVSETIGRKSG